MTNYFDGYSVKNITQLSGEHKEAFFALAEENLPGSSPDKMKKYSELFPAAFVTLVEDDTVVGVTFGWLRSIEHPDDDSFTLDGIAVRWGCQKKGYGKILLNAFEKAAADYGAPSVSVGSAGGYVERFYIDCGYIPKHYKIWIDGAPVIVKEFSDMADYNAYIRKSDDGFVVLEKQISVI